MCCLWVKEINSRAVKRPRAVTESALSLRRGGIDIVGVCEGRRLDVSKRPAITLPQASRLRGLEEKGLFSLIGGRARKRGWLVETREVRRML